MSQDRKLGSMTFTTDGDTIAAFFTDHAGSSTDVLQGRSMGDCYKAIGDMVTLMQHRNGIVNFNPDGTIADGITESLRSDLERVAAADTGKGWG